MKEIEHPWVSVFGNPPAKANCDKIIVINGHGSIAKTPAVHNYEYYFYLKCGCYRNMNIDNLFEFECKVYFPSMRSDIDNSLKILLDCLQQCKAIKNDNKCVKVIAEKFIDKENPRVEFRIIELCQ